MQKLTVREAAENLGISEDAVRKRIQRGTLAHRKASDGHVYIYMDNYAGAQQETSVEEINNTNQNNRSLWWDYAAGASAFLVITSGLIYVLGLFTLWTPITMMNTDYLTAWHAASLVPKTVVAGLGVKQLIALPLLTGILIFVTLFFADRLAKLIARGIKAVRKRMWKRPDVSAGTTPKEQDDIEEYEPGALHVVGILVFAQWIVCSYSAWLIANAPGPLSGPDVTFLELLALLTGIVGTFTLLCWSIFNLFERDYKWALITGAGVGYLAFRCYQVWHNAIVPDLEHPQESGVITNALTTTATITVAATIVFFGALFVYFGWLAPGISFLPHKETWEGSIVMVACTFIAAFMFTIPSKPPLPTAQIDTKNNKQVNGLLLVHSEGFWYIFQAQEGERKSTLRAIPDDEVKTVWVSKAPK